DLAQLGLLLGDMDRNPDGAAGVLKSALDRLADPKRPVGRELETAAPVELLHRPDQPEHALLHQVLHRQAQPLVAAGLGYDQAQVGVDHALFGLEVAALNSLGEL